MMSHWFVLLWVDAWCPDFKAKAKVFRASAVSPAHQNRFAELPGDDTVPAQLKELFAAGLVENAPTTIEAVSEGASQGLPATFAMDAEDTESLASRTIGG